MREPQEAVRGFPDPGPYLTVRTTYRQPDRMPTDILLHERVHVDLARTASATCPGR
jgi:hypothetical protein